MENWEKAKLIADKFDVLQKEDGDINDDVLLAIESALSQHDVSRQSELLCDFLEWYDVDLTLEEREMEIKTYMDMKSHN